MIPNGVQFIDKNGNIISSMSEYNNAKVCIVSNKDEVRRYSIIKYSNGIMPEYIPTENGVYCLKQDPDFDWYEWFDITSSIQILEKSGLIKF